jgi:hypothetical protein
MSDTCPDRELCEAERSSGMGAASILFKFLGWSAGGLHAAASEVVERAERAERQRDEAVALLRGFVDHYKDRRQMLGNGYAYTHFTQARKFLAHLEGK